VIDPGGSPKIIVPSISKLTRVKGPLPANARPANPDEAVADGGRHGDQERALVGGARGEGRYEPAEIEEPGPGRFRGYSEALGLYVCWEARRLEWYDPAAGVYLPGYDAVMDARDAAQSARLSAESRADQAESARLTAESRADQAEARIRQLEAENRRLRG